MLKQKMKRKMDVIKRFQEIREEDNILDCKAGFYGATKSRHITCLSQPCPGKTVFGFLWESPGQKRGRNNSTIGWVGTFCGRFLPQLWEKIIFCTIDCGIT